jgi:dTDP-4-dehydrorhamnose reductase
VRILITGGRGQLATDLVAALRDHQVIALGRDQLDITDRAAVPAALDRYQPQVVVNTAAYHAVDLCEDEPEQSFAVNAAAAQRLAALCDVRNALLVYISTDYVFGGCKSSPYTEDDPVDPISVYGVSKAAGEMAIRSTTDRHLIVRTSGLYGRAGAAGKRGNFVQTMLRLGRQGKSIAVVDDQVLTPSYTRDVADVIARLIQFQTAGTYHVTSDGQCSWYEFAEEIFRLSELPARLARTTQAERPTPARRPAYSVLAHDGIRRLGIQEPRPWQEALRAYLSEMKFSSSL